ncbi:MAG: ATP-grasp domain-containing protein [Phyllobacterium sp.]
MPAALPNSPAILIAAVSGRSLASAARRAGYRPFVADLFNDSDTLALAERAIILPGNLHHGIDGTLITRKLLELMGGEEPFALVYGSGFERKPEIVETLGRTFPLAGNSARTIEAVKDPLSLSCLCQEIGIAHPEIRLEAPLQPKGWLTKLAGGAGGSHVRRAGLAPSETASYFQAFVPGRNLSTLFLAQGAKAHIVGFSRQWPSPSNASPFRYGGAVRLARFDRNKRHLVRIWLDHLVQRTGLVGLCSADFIDGPEGLHLIEINPRPGATLDIFDNEDTPLLTQHLRAVRGETIEMPTYRDAAASAIAYASHPIPRFPDIQWPSMTADHQQPGTRLGADDPVCTVFAKAQSAAAAEWAVKNRIQELEKHWREDFQ